MRSRRRATGFEDAIGHESNVIGLWVVPAMAGWLTLRPSVAAPSRRAAGTLTALTALAVIAPALVHLLPGPALGPRLLPAYYAALLAALCLRLPVAVLVSVATPLLNHLLTGLPPAALLPRLILSVGLFMLAVRATRALPWVISVPAAYVGSLAISMGVLRLFGEPSGATYLDTLITGLPGIVVLSVLGLILDRWLR